MALTSEDWLALGLELLGEEGADAIRVERLCRKLKVSKGSFYHHFINRQAYLDALLDYWQQRNTQDVINAVASLTDPRQRGDQLSALVQTINPRPELALRNWAAQSADVARRVAIVDRERTIYLETLLNAQFQATEQTALFAQLIYAHFVGCQMLGEQVTPAKWKAMDNLLRLMADRTLTPRTI
jgi:AcrR family transcriptional regulator